MISKQEIMSQARGLKLAPDIIEKDYVLNWVLAGIRNQSNLRVEYYWGRLPEVLDWIYEGKHNE